MKLDIQDLQATNDHYFELLKNRVKNRLLSNQSVEWFVDLPDASSYQPDYLTMGSAGRSRFEQSLNKLLSRLLPAIWMKTFFRKIGDSLVDYTENRYFKKIFHQVNDPLLIEEIKQVILNSLRNILGQHWQHLTQCTFTELSNCLLAVIHEPFKQLPIEKDVFLQEKEDQNNTCMKLLEQIDHKLRSSDSRLDDIVYLCCRSNWIDSLEDDAKLLLNDFVKDICDRQWGKPYHDSRFYQLEAFKAALERSSGPVLYETDNCGEIVFDLLLVEYLLEKNRKVNLCLKQGPVVNDAMIGDVEGLLQHPRFEELSKAKQERRLNFVSAGEFLGGGKLPHSINREYIDAFVESELVILKGQGNFQSMPIGISGNKGFSPYNYRKPIVYMTAIKADLIQMCLTSVFHPKDKPEVNSLMLYVHQGGHQ